MLASEQIKNFVVALGCAIGDTFDITKLRYHKIIIATDADVAVSEPIMMEVLEGARSVPDLIRLRSLLTSFEWVPTDTAADFEAAAKVYADCRAAGFTPGGLIDCMIAAIAMRTGAELLAADLDFRHMANVIPLTLA